MAFNEFTCSLGLSKRLAELYNLNNTIFVWNNDNKEREYKVLPGWNTRCDYPAPTAEELGRLIPCMLTRETCCNYDNRRFQYYKKTINHAIFYCIGISYYGYTREHGKNCANRQIVVRSTKESDVRAKILIELKDIIKYNKHIMLCNVD